MTSVAKQLEMKTRLERIFRPEVSRVFNAITREFKVSVGLTGFPTRTSRYNAIWESLLDKHYRRVQRNFKGVVKGIKQTPEDNLLELALQAWRDGQARGQAAIINNTTRNNMIESISIARQRAADIGVVLTDEELARNSAAVLAKKFKGRTQGIIITETQSAAEMTKYAEVEVLSGLEPRILGGTVAETKTTKRWLTVGDKHVRPIHREANGQVKPLTEPYVVNNQLLMFPGDNSLGATIENLANCRCISLYKFV